MDIDEMSKLSKTPDEMIRKSETRLARWWARNKFWHKPSVAERYFGIVSKFIEICRMEIQLKKSIRLISFLVCVVAYSDAMASENTTCEQNTGHSDRQASLYFENDMFSSYLGLGQSDKWYTNGVKLVYTYNDEDHTAVTGSMKGMLTGLTHSLFGECARHGVVLGQLMFTPKNIAISTSQPNDRFYGGWLYFGGVIQNNDEVHTRTAELDVGLVGPNSFAEQTQKAIHSAFGYTNPAGWNYQIRNELGVQFSYNDIVRFQHATHTDASYYYGGSVGTVFDNIKGGLMFRLGTNLDGVPISNIESPVIGAKLEERGGYLLLRGEFQGVIHNTFIDGSLINSLPFQSNVTSRPLVGQLTFGFVKEGVLGYPAKFSFLVHRKTAEFTSPAFGRNTLFTYGTVNVECPL